METAPQGAVFVLRMKPVKLDSATCRFVLRPGSSVTLQHSGLSTWDYGLGTIDNEKMCNCTALWQCSVLGCSRRRSPAYKAPIKAPAPFSWTGFYVGGNVGYGWGSASLDGGVASLSPKGVDGGVQLGYNYEVGQVVFGLEGDFQFADHKDSISASGGGATETLEAKSDWFSTARGRIGFAFDRFLPYVTGGVAFTHTKLNDELTAGGVLFASASADKTSTGYAIGGGLEYAIDRNWSVKGEYLHLGFGTQTYDFTSAGGPAFSVGSKLSFDIARLGVNYRF